MNKLFTKPSTFILYVTVNYPEDEKQTEHGPLTAEEVAFEIRCYLSRETESTSFVFTVS